VTLTANERGDWRVIDGLQRPNDVITATAPAEQRLIRHLLRHYDVDARGVTSVHSTIHVAIQLLLLRMQQLVRLYTVSPATRILTGLKPMVLAFVSTVQGGGLGLILKTQILLHTMRFSVCKSSAEDNINFYKNFIMFQVPRNEIRGDVQTLLVGLFYFNLVLI